MAELIYTTLMSLDGYVADANGAFDWAVPSEEVHAFVNDLERTVGTYLYGRRTYQVMLGWEDAEAFADQPPVMQDFACIWRAADKIVYTTTLLDVASARTSLRRTFDPGEVRRLKAASDRDLNVAGPTLAAHAFHAGLVDACHLFLAPIVVGGGTRALPDGARLDLELHDQRSFESGMAYLHYGVRP